MKPLDVVFTFKVKNQVLIVLFKNEIIYMSNINRIMEDTIMNSIEKFVFYEICEYNPQLGYYQYDFCKCFLNFAKELNK